MAQHTSACNPERFNAFALTTARELKADLLLSCADHPAATRSVVGIEPTDELIFTDSTDKAAVKAFCFKDDAVTLGFISYDYGMRLRGVRSTKPRSAPPGHLKQYAAVVEFDGQQVTIQGRDDLVSCLVKRLEATSELDSHMPVNWTGPVRFSLGKAAYEQGVEAVLEAIRAGRTYQLNLSTQISRQTKNLDGLDILASLYHAHPAPFYAWFRTGHQRIISTSPERFLRVEDGEVLSQPIKGTMHVGDDEQAALGRLLSSPKEDAELSMIVDLIRNDISADCAYGSVTVHNHKSVFRVDDLLQMYSDVRGMLRRDRDCLDLFFSAFPGGSITGCPKLSSMEIIEALEPHARGVYCGSLVVIRGPRDMDSSIAIRTAVHDTHSGQFDVYAGSGIVVDSNPAKEYLETMAKAGKFLHGEER